MEIICTFKISDSNEISEVMFPKRNVYIINGGTIFILIYVLINCLQNNLATNIVLFLIVIVAIAVLQYFLYRQKKNYFHLIYERFQETNTGDKIIYKYKFDDQFLAITNTNTNAHVDINYQHFNQYLETTNYVLVVSKAKQYIIFNKDIAKKYELKEFFMQKNPSIRTKKGI